MSIRGQVSDETVNGRLRAFRRSWNFLEEDGLWEEKNPTKGIKLLKTAKRIREVVDPTQIQKIVKKANKKRFEGIRDLIILLLMWDGMLRRGELLGLKIKDIDMQTRLVRVFGKGRKERMVPLGAKTLRLINQYINKWRVKFPGNHLICMRDGEPMAERRCHHVVAKLGKRAGIKLNPHLLRHSGATWYIQQGGNPAVLQGILGHTSLTVTQKYLHLSNRDAVKSYEQFSPGNCLRF